MDFKKEYNEYKVNQVTVKEKLKGNFISIIKSEFTLNNKSVITREEIVKNNENSNAVIILAVTTTNKVILVMQPRVFKEGIALELPSGYIDYQEESLEAAKRELKEETGYESNNFIKLFSYYQDQGCSKVKNDCYLATNCIKTSDLSLDHDEQIKVFEVDINEVYNLLDNETVNDAGSVITLLKGKHLL